jgi:hypothetical protein
MIEHWDRVSLAIPLQFSLKSGSGIDRGRAFVVFIQVLSGSFQEIGRTFSMAAVHRHVKTLGGHAEIQPVAQIWLSRIPELDTTTSG